MFYTMDQNQKAEGRTSGEGQRRRARSNQGKRGSRMEKTSGVSQFAVEQFGLVWF